MDNQPLLKPLPIAFGEVKSEEWKVKNQSYYAPPPFVNEELRMKSEEFATAL